MVGVGSEFGAFVKKIVTNYLLIYLHSICSKEKVERWKLALKIYHLALEAFLFMDSPDGFDKCDTILERVRSNHFILKLEHNRMEIPQDVE